MNSHLADFFLFRLHYSDGMGGVWLDVISMFATIEFLCRVVCVCVYFWGWGLLGFKSLNQMLFLLIYLLRGI